MAKIAAWHREDSAAPPAAKSLRTASPEPPRLPERNQPFGWELVDGSSSLFLRVTAAFALLAIVLHLFVRYLLHQTGLLSLFPLYLVLLIGGIPLVAGLVRKLVAREFGSDLLAGLSILTAVALHEYLVAAVIVLMLSGGQALEDYASRRASAVLDALAKRLPQTAHRKTEGHVSEAALADVSIGDLLVVYPHEICPADGVVVEGNGRMNEAFLTGEPFEISKAPGAKVLSGAVNEDAALTIRVERGAADSRYARIMRVMEETQQHRPRLRRLGDQLGAWYTPVAILIALAAWALTGEWHRFLAVVVIATPCPLLIAIPVTIIGAISIAARSGIIIKNPAILDKTGTLTYGRPSLTEIECAPQFNKDDVLRAAASLERYSKHPLAAAILDAADLARLELQSATEVEEPPGRGLRGFVAGRAILLTGRSRTRPETELPQARSGLECIVFIDGAFAAVLHFHDAPRKDSRIFLSHLGQRHHVNRVMLVSGDRDAEVRYLAAEVGIRDVRANASPEEKLAVVREETAAQKTLFVGDGINDAPAMQAATVGVALGQNSDVAAEAADAVIMESSLAKLDDLIHIGRRMRHLALISAVGGMTLSMLGMLAAAFGFLQPIGGAIAQEFIDLAAVLNAVRMAIPTGKLNDL